MGRRGAFYYGAVLYFGAALLIGYIVHWTIKLVWWLLKLLWFVLAVLPFRAARKIRQIIHDRRLRNAESRMAEYMDNNS